MPTKIDLNIVDRGTEGSNWVAEDTCLTPEHLDEVMEQKTDNSGALNSLPTPFARFFVAREAFRRATEERLHYDDPTKEAGFAYRWLVSDILDVYELLFNLTYHENAWTAGQKIEIREWKYADNMNIIKAQMPVLYNSINEYYQTDIAEAKLHFIVLTELGKEKLLACTSPLTGFVTPPDLDKSIKKVDGASEYCIEGEQYKDLHIHRKSGGEYFRDIKMFEKRDEDFKNYMYNIVFSSDSLHPNFKAIKEYIRSFKNDRAIRNDYSLSVENLRTEQNDELKVNGLAIMKSAEIDVNDFFAPTLIKIPYRIAQTKFKSVTYQNDYKDRDYDYLLPFKPDAIKLIKDNKGEVSVHINKNSVTVYLKYKGKEYKKEYAKEPLSPAWGKIVDLKSDSIAFDLGLFPNILSWKPEENNYFNVMVVAADEDAESPSFSIDKISLSFYKNGELIREVDQHSSLIKYGVFPAAVRSRQKSDNAEASTKFYEVFNTDFDMIEIDINGAKGLILPVFKLNQREDTQDIYRYAVDLGTSNTFISRCKEDEDNLPEMFKMDESMVSYMHEPPTDNQRPEATLIEDSIFDLAKNHIKTEFMPAFIDGEVYRFPIRTALCSPARKANEPALFKNHNIAFFYEKTMPNNNLQIHTDIKWDDNDKMLRVFIRQLLLMIKTDVLQRNGNLEYTSLVWFRPLSFMGAKLNTFQEVWTSEAGRILGISASQISCFTESEAPYYFFKKKNYIKDSQAVAVIDIGGGTTDFVYFQNNHPVMANSVHFGCDVLWENGFNEFSNARENGIYKHYSSTLHFNRNDLETLNIDFKNNKQAKTKDIINFWLGNTEFCDIRKLMSNDFKPVFVYHLTSILFYMANMYKDYGLTAPHSMIFSGNGSKYIDNFIGDKRTLKKIIDLTFEKVFTGKHDVKLELPVERKEATCYGGLYREKDAEDVPDKVYQGDLSHNFEKVGDINRYWKEFSDNLVEKYKAMNTLFKDILELLKRERVISNTEDTHSYVEAAMLDMRTPLGTYYQSKINDQYSEDVFLNEVVFFLPIKDRVFELTKLNA